jgi:hypothetical protein
MRTPDKPLPAKDAILSQIDMAYYPEYRLSCTVAGPAGLSFRISFTNLAVRMELLLQYEVGGGAYIEGVPYITGIVFTLISRPRILEEALQVTLFSGSNLLNRDYIKRAIGDAISTAAWKVAGMPNGCAMERVGGSWQVMQVVIDDRMARVSLSRGELLRYSRLKHDAIKFCDDLKIAGPQTIQTVSYRDVGISGKNFETFTKLRENMTVESVCANADLLNAESLSAGELRWFVEVTLTFMETAFKDLVERCTHGKYRPDDRQIGLYYGYLNAMQRQGRLNQTMWNTLKLEARMSKFEEIILSAQKKLAGYPPR